MTRSYRAAAFLVVGACSAPVHPSAPAAAPPVAARPRPVAAVPVAAPAEPIAETREHWLRRKLPEGGRVERAADGTLHVYATRKPGESLLRVARAYLPLTELYEAPTLARALEKGSRGKTAEVEIPHLVRAALPDDPERERLAPPTKGGLRAVFITGAYASVKWIETLDKVRAHGLNAVVLDGKDYEGQVNYPSKAKIAVETKASPAKPFIPDLSRAIRMAHDRGLYIILRIPAFHDPWSSKRAPRISVQGTWGRPFPMGWLDPQNAEAHDYIVELAEEGIAAGADEIQLDYVRFPVHHGTEKAVFVEPKDGARMNVIRDFVRKVHARTKAHGVPLSLDIFGITATGTYQKDLEMLGQDIAVLAPEAEVLSPMVYPSHYSAGWMGFAQPGDHPEIIGIATKAAVAKLPKGSTTVIRQWLQAFPDRSPHFGADYVRTEARLAEEHGGVGWLLWAPSCNYWAAWQAWPAAERSAVVVQGGGGRLRTTTPEPSVP